MRSRSLDEHFNSGSAICVDQEKKKKKSKAERKGLGPPKKPGFSTYKLLKGGTPHMAGAGQRAKYNFFDRTCAV